MKSRLVSFCTILAVMAVVLGLAGCPREPKAENDPDEKIPVTGISLNKSSLTLATGDTEKLNCTITPADATDKTVSWSSDNPNFATVSSDGRVTAVAIGTATITVTTADGNFTKSATVTVVQSVPVTGITLNKSSLTLTIHSSEKVIPTIAPNNATNKNVNWSSSNTSVATVASDGTITAVNFTTGGNNQFTSGPATGTATITATTQNGSKTATVTVTATTAAQVDIGTLPPLKTQFAGKFLMGNIFNPSDVSGSSVTNTSLTRHFNVLTAENNMKPSYIAPSQGSYNFVTADSMVNAARASGFQVVGHTLLWHSQNANWMNNIGTDKNTALTAMKKYITDVVTHFQGKIYSWDVLNEVFPDGVSASADWKNSMRKAGDSQAPNPWYVAIGSDFVYEGYLAARLADPDAILYYNDYNLDSPGKATMVRDMVRDVNQQYAAAYPGANRKLIEGIGMQSHHNTNVTAAQIRATLVLFKPLGVKISVSELDVLGQGYSEFASVGQGTNKHGNSTVTNNGLMTEARLYGEYMALFLEYSDIIERVSLWGVTDNQSWRSAGLPLLFDPSGKAKPTYYKFVGALPQ